MEYFKAHESALKFLRSCSILGIKTSMCTGALHDIYPGAYHYVVSILNEDGVHIGVRTYLPRSECTSWFETPTNNYVVTTDFFRARLEVYERTGVILSVDEFIGIVESAYACQLEEFKRGVNIWAANGILKRYPLCLKDIRVLLLAETDKYIKNMLYSLGRD